MPTHTSPKTPARKRQSLAREGWRDDVEDFLSEAFDDSAVPSAVEPMMTEPYQYDDMVRAHVGTLSER